MAKDYSRIIGIVEHEAHEKKRYEKVEKKDPLAVPSIYHALVIIFLEFFAWGLLTGPMVTVLNKTFPDHTFLFNGLILGVKGCLSFLCAPLLGAMSDVWGRKPFLILTVTCTCAPIALMKLSPWWFFAMVSLSGVFSVTFSVVFAYVSDITVEEERSSAFGLVSATFAASLVISPTIGAYLSGLYGESFVVAIATAVAIFDTLFILAVVPESLPLAYKKKFTWEQVDPFLSLRQMGKDKIVVLLCVAVFLSYLPEAGEFSCFFVYMRLVIGFSMQTVASFMAVVGILSVLAQNFLMSLLLRYAGPKHTIVIGLVCEVVQLAWYAFATKTWMIWAAGVIASVNTITYPAISSFISMHASADQQGVSQGIVTGIRGLCSGLGPALFGLIFHLFHVDLREISIMETDLGKVINGTHKTDHALPKFLPGPPFLFGAVLVVLAIVVTYFIPNDPHKKSEPPLPKRHRSRKSPKRLSDPDLIEEGEPLMFS